MARRVLIIGKSGTGKSTSLMTLDPKETFIINVEGKDLPFKPKGYTPIPEEGAPVTGNVATTDSPASIMKYMRYVSENRPEIKTLVIDDWQYVAMHQFMSKISEKGFEKFNKLGKDIVDIASFPKKLRGDLIVYYVSHQDTDRNEFTGEVEHKAKSFGKLVDNAVGGLEGLFTMVIYTKVEKTKEGIKHYFVTQNDGSSTAKTPIGMFEETLVPNDLQMVSNTISEYYEV